MSKKEQIILDKVPKHIAVIMDGNGRWAMQQGQHRVKGHQHGVNAVQETVEACAEIGVKYLTLYAFSTENWNRPIEEVNALMELLVATINSELPTLQKNKIRLQAIGDLNSLPTQCRADLMSAIDATKTNEHMTLVLALSYSSKWELTEAIKAIASKSKDGQLDPSSITADIIQQYLQTANWPDPELLIRTSGEHRISNFLLWQIAYSEFYFTDTLWPDFKKDSLFEAVIEFQQRERRFGLTSAQLNSL